MKNREEEVKEVNLLDFIPVWNINWEKNEERLIVLLKPKFKNPLLKKHILPHIKRPFYKIKLDAEGSFLWQLCDGNRTVREIGRLLHCEFGEKVEPLYDRMALFLRSLEKNEFIVYKNKEMSLKRFSKRKAKASDR